jgi:predicted ATPase
MMIRTPDQRVRVFVSSTLGELAEERAAVRAAIERLRLTPVMFELGARPHPPRALYRAYLDQSHVFVGIYWERYGWVAPGEAVSGLEDEYRLAGTRPRLLYLKQPAENAEPRLLQLISDFATDDLASFKKFGSGAELEELVADDLAVLLSERFEQPSSLGRTSDERAQVPSPPYPLVDRDTELRDAIDLVRSGTRVVTLTGIGGIGKTRLAIEAALVLRELMRVEFVSLGAITDVDSAVRSIAEALCVRVEGSGSRTTKIADQLRGRPTLLVLDNVEQIRGIEAVLNQLTEEAADLQILVTSRRALRIRAEREVRIPALPLPRRTGELGALADEPTIALFVDRARAVGSVLQPVSEHAAQLVEINRRLEGIPLAIELAAAWTRLLSPQELLERLADPLAMLVGGSSDAPERQRALRNTIEWSYDLLDEPARRLFQRLSVFANGWTMEAAESVCSSGDLPVLETMSSLLDASLITAHAAAGSTPRFTMFASVRSYAAERLVAAGEHDVIAERHLDYYCALGELAQPALCGHGQRRWVERLDPERPDLRRAVDTALAIGRHESVVELAWDVVVLYFVVDAVEEPASWLRSVIDADRPLDRVTDAKVRSLHALTEVHAGRYEGVYTELSDALLVFRAEGMEFEVAVTLHQIAFVRYHLQHDEQASIDALRESSTIFDRIGHHWGVALVESMLASVLAAGGQHQAAAACAERALSRARTIENEPMLVQAFHQLSFVRLLEQREPEAFELLRESAVLSRRNSLRTDASYCLDALALIALVGGDTSTAAEAVAKAADERSRLRVAPWPTLAPSIERVASAAERRLGRDAYDSTVEAVTHRDVFEVLDSVIERVGASLRAD